MRMRWRGFELPTRVLVEESSKTDTYGKFVAEPFESGYGITVGNSLRRVLLSSIEGAAPISLKIEGATHEFTAIPGIYEDVINIALNIKGLEIKVKSDQQETLVLEKTAEGPVTAADFKSNPNVEIVNPKLHIATIVGKGKGLKLEVVVANGRGFKTADEIHGQNQVLGIIPLDATFSPVKRARWHVEDTRVGQTTNYDRLTLEIWTNGTVTPEQALVEASSILRKHLNPFVKYFEIGREFEREGLPMAEAGESGGALTEEDKELIAKLQEPVSILEPSVRAANCLAAEGIRTIADLVSRQESEMLQVRNFGKTSLKEIKSKLHEMGLGFGVNVEDIMNKARKEG